MFLLVIVHQFQCLTNVFFNALLNNYLTENGITLECQPTILFMIN